ncbi:MAG: hypothetical protein QM770_02925 [Tepidisphaeraceae bacterium]
MSFVSNATGVNRYAFSFDREQFRGDFDTRELALAAAYEAARELGGAVEAIYVGKRVPVPAQTDDHAESVVRAMRRRMLEKTGDANYLATVNEHVMADLDAAIELAIVDWQKRHQLQPASRVQAISEHPLPTVKEHAPVAPRSETRLIGVDG